MCTWSDSLDISECLAFTTEFVVINGSPRGRVDQSDRKKPLVTLTVTQKLMLHTPEAARTYRF